MPVIHHISPKEAAFQLALCFRIGFGISRNDDQALKFEILSSSNIGDLKRQVDSIRYGQPIQSIQDEVFKNLFLRGHVRSIDYPQYYREKGLLHRAENNYKREIIDAQEAFGNSHWLTLLLKTRLGIIFGNSGRWKEAESLFVQVMELRKQILGQEHPDTLSSIDDLAAAYDALGEWSKSESLQVHVTEMRKRVLGEEHLDTLTSTSNLALSYVRDGGWGRAEELYTQVLEIRSQVFGAEHPDTLDTVTKLAGLYRLQGRWKEVDGKRPKNWRFK
jgi:tetratricopeptide (TPR) repeat protein